MNETLAKLGLVLFIVNSIAFNSPIFASEDWASWAAVIVALLLGLGGIFSIQDWIKNKLTKPTLSVEIKLGPPDCLKIAVSNSQTGQFLYYAYYFRLRVENIGNYQMQEVEVVVLELEKKGRNNRYSKVSSFLPMNLTWSHIGQVTIPKIQPGLFKYCDLGHVVESIHANLQQFGITTTSQIVFILDTQVTPNTGSNILLPGEYSIKITFAANNVKPQSIWFKLNIADNWTTNEQQMLGNYISIERVNKI